MPGHSRIEAIGSRPDTENMKEGMEAKGCYGNMNATTSSQHFIELEREFGAHK